jgi:hypothetical protein
MMLTKSQLIKNNNTVARRFVARQRPQKKQLYNSSYKHATIVDAVFSVGAAPRLYIEDLTQLGDRIEGVSRLSRTMGRKELDFIVCCSDRQLQRRYQDTANED